ncbi:MAG TPA: glycosyltransferase family 2 protein [Ignavibacteriales bacterium]|nr:glycosyltransferase family 2 protein [Ignavibacteriales bacterium]
MLNNLNQEIKVCAIIPFYNEEDFLTDVVTETLEYVDKVFAVDDGSTDNSTKKINYFDRVQLISLDRNYGKGYALQSGFDEAIVQGFDIIITLDADKQHNPEFIPDFLSKAAEYDIVIGNRLNDIKIMPIQRVISNTITSRLLSIKTGQKILDSQCGFRAYRSRVIKKVKSHSFGYEAESEMIIYAARAGFRIGFTNISTIYGDEKSKMNSFKAISGFVKILFR